MIEDRIAEMFRAVTANRPPLGFTPDDIVTRVRQRRARVRVVATAAVATCGVAVAAAVATGTNPVPVSLATPGSTVTTTPTSGGVADLDAEVARLCQVIPAVLAERAPGLTIGSADTELREIAQTRWGGGCVYGVAGTTNQQVAVRVFRDRHQLHLAGDPVAGWATLVSETTRPDGSHLRVYRLDEDRSAEGQMRGLTVVHLRTDGVIVQVDNTKGPEPGQQDLAVSQDVLTAIATDPRLTL